METVDDVMSTLEALGSAQTRKTFQRHGAPADKLFGVKVGDLKPIAKRLQGRQELALELYATGNSDAMYLAALIVDGSRMTKRQLESWAKGATWSMIAEYAVPWAASESPYGRELALRWIDSKRESLATTGWCTYSAILSTTPDDALDLAEVEALLQRAVREIETAPNRVKYVMNGFVIAVGAYVRPLLAKAKSAAKKIGVVAVDVGDTGCSVPEATATIAKIEALGRVGKKRKTARC